MAYNTPQMLISRNGSKLPFLHIAILTKLPKGYQYKVYYVKPTEFSTNYPKSCSNQYNKTLKCQFKANGLPIANIVKYSSFSKRNFSFYFSPFEFLIG